MTKLINLGTVTGQTKFNPPDQTATPDGNPNVCHRAIVVVDAAGTKATVNNVLCSANPTSEGVCLDTVPPC